MAHPFAQHPEVIWHHNMLLSALRFFDWVSFILEKVILKTDRSNYFGVKPFSQTIEQGWLLGPGKIGPWKSFCVELSNFLMERNPGEATAQKGDSSHPYFLC